MSDLFTNPDLWAPPRHADENVDADVARLRDRVACFEAEYARWKWRRPSVEVAVDKQHSVVLKSSARGAKIFVRRTEGRRAQWRSVSELDDVGVARVVGMLPQLMQAARDAWDHRVEVSLRANATMDSVEKSLAAS